MPDTPLDLDSIRAAVAECRTYNFGMYQADRLAHEHAPAMLAEVERLRAEPDTIPLSLHNALIEQERRNAATRREERDREWRAALADPVKPDREAVIEAMSAALHVTTDRIPGLNPGPVLSADCASVVVAADAVLDLWPGRSEAEVLHDAADTMEAVSANADVAEAVAFVPGETGRAAAIANGERLHEEPWGWLREHAAHVSGVTAADRETERANREAEVKAEARTLAAAGPRFWPRVKVGSKTECWAWTGPALPFGHGTWDGPYGKTTAHRYAWALANAGMPASGVVIRHKCDNPICCNPNHLEPGSQEENVRDMIERGRATFTDALCRNGHDRTPDNTLTRADGTRRCKECSRAQQAERRKGYVPLRCLYCDHAANVYNLRRHIQRVHGETVGATELRARAEAGAP